MKKSLLMKSLLLLFALVVGTGSSWADNYDVTYNYSDLGSMISGSKEDANSYWKVPASAGNTATIAIPITVQPTSNITITFNIACFGSGTNPSSTNTTITAVGTETGSNWTGSGVSTLPSSSTYVNGTMTITKPTTPTTLGGLTITMGVNTGIKIFRLKSLRVQYTYTASVAEPTFTPAAGTYTSAQDVTLSCSTTGATIRYTLDGSEPTSTSTEYTTTPIHIASTTTIKAKAFKGTDESTLATATYNIYPVEHAGTSADPYTVADARNAIDANTGLSDVYVTGIVCEGGSNLSSGAMNYWISDDGTETNKFEIYKGKGISGANFSSTDDVQVGDIVVVTGDIKKFGSTYEFNDGSQLVSLNRPVTPIITVTPSSLTNFTYGLDNGPSEAQTFSVAGSNLTADITLSLGGSSNYEISTTENSGYTNSLTLTQTAGTVAATDIYVRLKAGLAINASYEGTVTLTSTGATTKTVSLTGNVTNPSYTFDLSTDQTVTATTTKMNWIGTPAVMGVVKGSASTATNNYYPGAGSNTSTRFYKNSILTITPISGYNITSIVFEATTDGYATTLNNSTWTNATAVASSKTVTVTPTTGTSAISATMGGTCGFTDVKVYYTGTTGETETISLNALCTDGTKYYGTYSTSKAFVVPTDLTVSEISVVTGELMVDEYNAGDIVPANTGVMVSSSTSGNHNVYLASGGTSVLGADNMLKPSGDADISAANMTAADTKFYRLTMHNGTRIGFWWGAAAGAAFDLAAHKAYLAIPNSAMSAREGLWFDGDVTAIENVKAQKADGQFYNLAGQRVAQPTKGMYIVNGKKVVIK